MAFKRFLGVILALLTVVAMVACGQSQPADETKESETKAEAVTGPAAETETEKAKEDVNVYVITGPTGIGAVSMWAEADNGQGLENYHFTLVASPTEVVAKLSNGEADIAAVATNMASKLYKSTSGGVKILAVNTLGVLQVLTHQGAKVESLADLKGRTVYTTGQGANPEYVLNDLLRKNGVDPEKDLTINFKAEGTELVTVWASEPEAVIVAPQPVATAILKKYEGSSISLDLTDEWNKVNTDSELMMGCVVVRTAFLEAHPQAVANFLKDYEASVKSVTEDPGKAGTLCAQYGIVAQGPVATAAIPHCHICCITGQTMKDKLSGYLGVLLAADPTSVGGAIPDDAFWYMG